MRHKSQCHIVTFVTWTWPCPFLSMQSIIIAYLNHAYENILPYFECWEYIIPVPRGQGPKLQNAWFWPWSWPDLKLILIFLGKNMSNGIITMIFEFYVEIGPQNMCHMTKSQYYIWWSFVTWPWTCSFPSMRSIIIAYINSRRHRGVDATPLQFFWNIFFVNRSIVTIFSIAFRPSFLRPPWKFQDPDPPNIWPMTS